VRPEYRERDRVRRIGWRTASEVGLVLGRRLVALRVAANLLRLRPLASPAGHRQRRRERRRGAAKMEDTLPAGREAERAVDCLDASHGAAKGVAEDSGILGCERAVAVDQPIDERDGIGGRSR
jgi:hypothetical protein